ncbi:MAG: site-specific integrase [Desulfuromonadales bacterium]|nr:site-specific integrase [Desulfuromonadales bacterium]
MMTDWYENSIRALQLAGMGDRTRVAYTRAVRQAVEFHDKTPDEISETELQDYFLYRLNETGWSPATMRICHSGLKFFFTNVLKRDWSTFNYLGVQKQRRLPTVLSFEEVQRIFASVYTYHNRVFLTCVYSCGLRLQEALNLETSDICGSRMLIHVHRGKGAKDRMVPLPEILLPLLRNYWTTHRHPRLLFPALGRNGQNAHKSENPMAISSVQGAMKNAVREAGIHKKGVSIHTLRHSYATHLLEEGVKLPTLQRYLGHATIDTTMLYLHLTKKGHEDASHLINALMKGLDHE